MFDIGFSELVVIGVVALVVLGPERLPKVARTAGHLFGRLQRYVANVKADLNREMELSELSKVKQEVQAVRTQTPAVICQPANIGFCLLRQRFSVPQKLAYFQTARPQGDEINRRRYQQHQAQ